MHRSLPVTLAAATAVLLLAGCTPSAPPVRATPVAASSSASVIPTSTATTTPTVTPTPSSPSVTPSPVAPVSSGAAGCSNGTTAIPAGAATTRITDVDGDGQRDTLFLTARVIGIRTAHGVFTIPDLLPQTGRAHTAWYTATDGAPGRTIVVDDGKHATVQAFQDCRIVRILDTSAQPLMLPIGGTTASATGVACNDQNGGILIQASRAVRRSDGRYDITWSNLSQVNAKEEAEFAAPETRWSSLAASDTRVAQARTSHCWAAIGTVTAPTS